MAAINVVFIFVMGLICIWLACILPETKSIFRIIIILPIAYTISYAIAMNLTDRSGYDAKMIIMMLLFLKDFMLPMVILLAGEFNLEQFNHEIIPHIPEAVVMQIIEMYFVSATVLFTKFTETGDAPEDFDVEEDKKVSKLVWKIIFICSIIILGAITAFPSMLNKMRPLFFLDPEKEIEWKKKASMAVVTLSPIIYYPINWLFVVTRMSFTYLLSIFVWVKLSRKAQNLAMILTFVIIGVILVYFVPDDVMASIIATISMFLLVTKLYPEKRKLIVRMIVVALVILFTYMFVIKPLSDSGGGEEASGNLALKLNAYFSGVINVAGAIAMDKGDRYQRLYGDIMRSFPIIRGFFSALPRSTEYFNRVLGVDPVYNSQVVPLEGQGYYYFDYFGVVILPVLTTRLSFHFYGKLADAKCTYTFFAYCFFTMLFALGLVMYDFFLTLYLALSYIPFLIINTFVLKRREN